MPQNVMCDACFHVERGRRERGSSLGALIFGAVGYGTERNVHDPQGLNKNEISPFERLIICRQLLRHEVKPVV